MTKLEATQYCAIMESKIIETKIVRILPESIDPIKENDSGWDVEITVNGEV